MGATVCRLTGQTPNQAGRGLKRPRGAGKAALADLILAPDHDDDEEIDDGKDDKTWRRCLGKPVELVKNKGQDDRERGWKRPEFLAPQAGDEEYFDRSVTEEISRREKLGVGGQVTEKAKDGIRNQVVRVLGQFGRCQPGEDAGDRGISNHEEKNAADQFQNSIQAFDEKAEPE